MSHINGNEGPEQAIWTPGRWFCCSLQINWRWCAVRYVTRDGECRASVMNGSFTTGGLLQGQG